MSVLKTYGKNAEERKSSKTFRLNEKNKKIEGAIDGLDAVRQAVYFILSTPRYTLEILSWDYGVELEDLYGKERGYTEGDLERRITEALMEDDRIKGLEDFKIKFEKEIAEISFTVMTDFGKFAVERSVTI